MSQTDWAVVIRKVAPKADARIVGTFAKSAEAIVSELPPITWPA